MQSHSQYLLLPSASGQQCHVTGCVFYTCHLGYVLWFSGISYLYTANSSLWLSCQHLLAAPYVTAVLQMDTPNWIYLKMLQIFL